MDYLLSREKPIPALFKKLRMVDLVANLMVIATHYLSGGSRYYQNDVNWLALFNS